jgi:uncharacterized membrane protein
MSVIEKSVEVRCPVQTVYNQWTQFEDFPSFMEGVREVRQIDDTHLHWHAEIAGADREWESEIIEQLPDQRIAWRAISGPENDGMVQFDRVGPDRTRVTLRMSYDPEGFIENAGDFLGVVERRVAGDMERFRKFVEERGETGAWRGTVSGGKRRQ